MVFVGTVSTTESADYKVADISQADWGRDEVQIAERQTRRAQPALWRIDVLRVTMRTV